MARRVLILVCLLVLCSVPANAQIKAKRQELSHIQVELKQTRLELEDLRGEEKNLKSDVKGLKSRDTQSLRRLEGIQADIRRAEARRADLKFRLDAVKSVAGFWSAAIAVESAHHAALTAARSETYGTRELWAEELRRSAIIEKAWHLRGLSGFRRKTEEAEAETGRRALDLDANRHREKIERDADRREYDEKKAALEATQVKVAVAAQRAKDLEESAKAMASLLDKLAKTDRHRGGAAARLELPPYSLPWPVNGKVLFSFGRERDEQLGTWTVRQGIVFASVPGTDITSIAPGTVIFAGPFRSYGKVVIIDHGDSFFSVYGELAEIVKNKSASVSAGEKIAAAGERMYLEIRRGAEALDPAQWLEKK